MSYEDKLKAARQDLDYALREFESTVRKVAKVDFHVRVEASANTWLCWSKMHSPLVDRGLTWILTLESESGIIPVLNGSDEEKILASTYLDSLMLEVVRKKHQDTVKLLNQSSRRVDQANRLAQAMGPSVVT